MKIGKIWKYQNYDSNNIVLIGLKKNYYSNENRKIGVVLKKNLNLIIEEINFT